MAYEEQDPGLKGEDGCKHRGQVIYYLLYLIDNFWLYFDKLGNLNSDGRRLAVKAAREAARKGCKRLSRRIFSIVNSLEVDHASLILGLLEECGVNVKDAYLISVEGPVTWRVQSKDI